MKKYTLKLFKNGGKIKTVRTRKKKRFLRVIRMINWENDMKKAYIKVSYGKKQCAFGCICDFYNDGYCDNQEDLLLIFRYFDEEE